MPPSPTNTTCPGCGAGIPVPETGLNMVCEYCSHEMPVPDVEQRRKAMEREAAHKRELEAREQKERHRREREEQKRAQRERDKAHNRREQARQARSRAWRARLATIPGCLMALVIIAISMAAPAIGLFQAGLLDAFVGDGGSSAHSGAQKAMISSGYTLSANPGSVRILGSSEPITVSLRDDLCYAFSVGSGALITSVYLEDPTGSTVASKAERAYGHLLTLCPDSTGIHQLFVQLDQQFGRYTWSWGWKAKATAPTTSTKSQSIPRAPRSSSKRSGRKR